MASKAGGGGGGVRKGAWSWCLAQKLPAAAEKVHGHPVPANVPCMQGSLALAGFRGITRIYEADRLRIGDKVSDSQFISLK